MSLGLGELVLSGLGFVPRDGRGFQSALARIFFLENNSRMFVNMWKQRKKDKSCLLVD